MEHGRIFLAIALSFLVFLVWGYFFPAENPPATTPASTMPAQQPQENKASVGIEKPSASAPPAGSIIEQDLGTSEPPKDIRIFTPLYHAVMSTRGAAIERMELTQYRETVQKDSPLKQLIPNSFQGGKPQIAFGDLTSNMVSESVFKTSVGKDDIHVENEKQSVVFSWTSSSNLTIVKQYTFHPDSYVIDLNIQIINHSNAALNRSLAIRIDKTISDSNKGYGFEGMSAYANHKLEQITDADAAKKHQLDGTLQWMALEDRYFMTAIVPAEPVDSKIQLNTENHILSAQWILPEKPIESNAQLSQQFHVYYGPKSLDILKTTHLGLEDAIHFGMFDILAKPFLWIMKTIHGVIPNYGIAIIILTILVKLILWPLGTKSYQSMAHMKKMQPLLNEIRTKYKDDKKRMNEETMALYKTYKVNPMGGCLPMVVQIPVFFALYRMLYEVIELRHAPFFGWINDLSAPDRLFHFPFAIPFMEPPYGIPVLTIIMGVTMFLQQKMSPPAGDPSQAKIMMAMPIVFTVIFINFPSGLVLYWLVNNIISIAQQYMIQKKFA
jgi:YidC/Oxa1 family membrane protein insertase